MSGETRVTRIQWETENHGTADFGGVELLEGEGNDPFFQTAQKTTPGATPELDSIKGRLDDLERRMRLLEAEIRRLKKASKLNEITHHIITQPIDLVNQDEWLSLPGLSRTITTKTKATIHVMGALSVYYSELITVPNAEIAVRVMVNNVEQDGRGTFAFQDNGLVIPNRREVVKMVVPFAAVFDTVPGRSYSIVVQAANLEGQMKFTVLQGAATRGDSYMTVVTHPPRPPLARVKKARTTLLAAAYDAFNDRIVVLRKRAHWYRLPNGTYGNFPSSSPDKLDFELSYYEFSELPVADFDAKPGQLIYRWSFADEFATEYFVLPGGLTVRASDGAIFVSYFERNGGVPATSGRWVYKLIDPAGFEKAELKRELTGYNDVNDYVYKHGEALFFDDATIFTGGYLLDDGAGLKKYRMTKLVVESTGGVEYGLTVDAEDTWGAEVSEDQTRRVAGLVVSGANVRVFATLDWTGADYRFYYNLYDTTTDTFGTAVRDLTGETKMPDPSVFSGGSVVVKRGANFIAAVRGTVATTLDVWEYTVGSANYGTKLIDGQAVLTAVRYGLVVSADDRIFFWQTSDNNENDVTTPRLFELVP